MLVPVLGIAAKAMNKAQMKLLIGGLLLFHVIIKTIVPAQLTADAAGMDAMWYVVLFFVAVYIRKFIAVGDVFTVILCVMLISLFTITYVSKDKVFRMFQAMIGLLMIASWSDLLWHSLIIQGNFSDTLIYIIHFVFLL